MPDEKVRCTDCGREFAATRNLARHRSARHGYVGKQAQRAKERSAVDVIEFVCPDCPERTFTTPQSLGYHRSRTHGNTSKRAQKKSAPAPVEPPPLGALLRVVEMSLDADDNVLVVLEDSSLRWQGVIFGRTQG